MTNDVATKMTAADIFKQFAAESVPPSFGKIVRFNKGDWFCGGEKVKESTLFVAQVSEAQLICTRWMNKKPTERRIFYVRDGARFPKRDTLGDLDQTKWEKDRDGKTPKDPWAFERCLPMLRVDDDALCCFLSATEGGKSAIGELLGAYAKRLEAGLFGLPIVELQATTYDHAIYGKTDKPVLFVESWQDHGLPPPAPRIGAAPVVTTTAEGPAALEAPPAKNSDMDDDIPF